jgi:nucleotide-binding universal stress UspA family protein
MRLFQNILYVSDSKTNQSHALKQAVRLAARNNQAALTVMEIIPASGKGSATTRFAAALSRLMALVRPYTTHLPIRPAVVTGPTAPKIKEAVSSNGHDLVIKPARPVGFMARLHHTDRRLLRQCPCPVLFIKGIEKPRHKTILAAVDLDPLRTSPARERLNQRILEMAAEFAVSEAANLHVVHCWEPFAEKALLGRGGKAQGDLASHHAKQRARHRNELHHLGNAAADRVRANGFSHFVLHPHLLKGPAATVLPPLATELRADLLILGTVAQRGLSGLFTQSVAEALLKKAGCSLLGVKPQGPSPRPEPQRVETRPVHKVTTRIQPLFAPETRSAFRPTAKDEA